MAQSCYGLLNLGIKIASGDLNSLQPQLCVEKFFKHPGGTDY